MGLTCKRAFRVIYWLGSPTWLTDHCLYALRRLEVKGRSQAHKAWTREQWLHLWSDCRRGNRAKQCEGLRDLLSRPWFRRVWIVQEVAHSRVAVVCCGKAFVSARIFGIGPYLLLGRTIPLARHCQAMLDMMPGPFR
ncbi:hypothetical protein B0T14DRAFT_508776 [Immersiella caudata]|uniref:Heterokaryon incompatibility domain-containing protein n=1 Tax=Immersiella caudata TaxID=314043 RepID=A0AA39X278_9PEZI|nr:hypothetical protein B0T14DRAFT_508776 [Immersiella caudata]